MSVAGKCWGVCAPDGDRLSADFALCLACERAPGRCSGSFYHLQNLYLFLFAFHRQET